MRILVTGGAGFIGSHTCDRLVEMGHDVVFSTHSPRRFTVMADPIISLPAPIYSSGTFGIGTF